MAIIPNVAPGELIESAWGNMVANELNVRCFKIDGTPEVARIRLTAANAASLVSTLHGFQLGPTSGENLIADTNDLQVRNNGNAAALRLNPGGGNVEVGAAGSLVTVRENMVVPTGSALLGKTSSDLSTLGIELRGPVGQFGSTVNTNTQNLYLLRRDGADVANGQFIRFGRA